MTTPATLQRTLQALFITGISTFALAPALAADTVEVTADAAEKPRLVLQITVDQFRGGLPTRYFERLGKGGLRYLLEEGIHYNNAHHAHANTETIVVHVTLATGAHPAAHGMIGNIWYDRASGATTYNIGHFFGPSSLESEDNILQLDRTLAKLFAYEDKEIGLENTLVVLSADHGGPEAPGYLESISIPAGYVSPWRYDTYVPIIFVGNGIKPQTVSRRVYTVDVAMTLATAIGTRPPSGAAGEVLLEVLGQQP